jgi:glyoxylase-like metal-dependent hydrolase (beta-lactamase superfamily II)
MSTEAMRSIGRPGDPAAVRSLRFDDVRATYVVDGVLTMRPASFFPLIPGEYWQARPELCTASGDLLMSAGGLLVDIGGQTLLIDAGVGEMAADFDFGSVDCGSMLDVLSSLGLRPDNIDVLVFTHLHFDHAGWAFANGAKTFPNARYVVATREWAPLADGRRGMDTATPRQIISQLASDPAGLELIDDGDEVVPGVCAIVTPGHTPGHTSYVITSQSGRRLIVFGDAFHSPAQFTHPDWLSIADPDADGVLSARRRLIDELTEPDTLGFGFHFGDQPFGRLIAGGSEEATWRPEPTLWLAAPPR